MVKKCFICERPMADHECGDELPEERICDECSSRVEIAVYDQRHGEWWFGYTVGEPVLVEEADQSWFKVETVLDDPYITRRGCVGRSN